jgi:photosystem II stability/assembly factor-like uncharacterized protein
MLMLRSPHARCAALVGLLAPLVALAQSAGFERERGAGLAGERYDPALLSALRWRSIGPNRGGRSIACAGSAARPLEYYFGATGGGLWKTTDGGLNWEPVTDGQIRSSSVGAVAVSESSPDVVYIGMGEVQLRGNVMQGDGVYRSTDAGKTWTHLGLADTHAIGRIRIHPGDPDVAYVAALGHPYGPNEQRGVFRTLDGGRTWKKVLYRGDRAGAVDLVLDPSDPQVLYASLWEVHRKPWLLWSGGPSSGLFKSKDAGETWTELTRNPGLPKGILGKIGVSVSRADPRRVYALFEAEDGGVFRSDDAGATWTKVNEDRDLRQRAFYFSRIYADPTDRDTVYVLNYLLHKSTDGGRSYVVLHGSSGGTTYAPAPGLHADHHDLWIDPKDPLRMIDSNDGGATVTTNGGRTWTEQGYPTAQMYHVATTRDFPYHVCGAQQDNTTACVPSDAGRRFRDPGKRAGDWLYEVGGNESGYIAPHPEEQGVFYAGGQEAYLTRYDRRTGEARDIQPYPWFYSGQSAGSVPERWQWTFPIVVSPHDPRVLYASSQHLWRTTNEGQSWERISPDLTRADPKTLGDSGGPITRDQNGPEFYATIFTIAPSRREQDTIWCGSDDGLVHLTRDGGRRWDNVTPPDMPEFTRVSLIEASPHRAGGAYVAGKRHQLDDRAPYIWKTADYGKSWTRIVAGIRPDDFVHAVREDPRRAGLLYAGTEHGVYVSFDDGGSWLSLALNLPDVQVPDLVVEEHDLVIATHGRSFYVLDDIDPLRQLTPAVAASPFHLFEPRPAVRRVRPAAVDYLLKQDARDVKVEILDARGALVRTLQGRGKPGLNRVTWDLRYPGATLFEGMILRSAQPDRGPLAPPGRYQVRVTADGPAQTRSLAIEPNPLLADLTQSHLEEQFALATKIRDATSAANEAVVRIRDVKKQLAARLEQQRRPWLAAAPLLRELSAVEEELYQVKNRSPKDPLNYPVKLNNRLAALGRVVESADARPTDQSYQVFEKLSAELRVLLGRIEAALERELPALNRALSQRGLPPIRPGAGSPIRPDGSPVKP